MRGSLPAIALVVFSLFMLASSYVLGLGNIKEPGPGFFPFWIAFFLALAALSLLGTCMLQNEDTPEETAGWSLSGIRNLLAVLGVTSLFGVLLDYLGFLFTTFAFLAFCWLAVERLSPFRGAFLALVSAVAAYLLFDRLLGVHFPRSLSGF